MPASRQIARINTLELKSEMESKLGRHRAELYFCLLTKFLNLKISKLEFNKFCIGTVGKENLHLHNRLIRSIVKNATLSTMGPPPRASKEEPDSLIASSVPNGYHHKSGGGGGLHSLCRDFPQSPRKGRTPSFRDRRSKDRPSPLGPHGKGPNVPCEVSTPKVQDQQSASELFSLGSRPPCSDEDGEEVEQLPPLVAPLGVLEELKTRRKLLAGRPGPGAPADTCRGSGGIPGTGSLMKRVKRKLEAEGLNVSEECANLLNCGLDAYLKRLMKPCLELSASRTRTGPRSSASVLDFRVAMETRPALLGGDWATKLERVCFYATEDRTGI